MLGYSTSSPVGWDDREKGVGVRCKLAWDVLELNPKAITWHEQGFLDQEKLDEEMDKVGRLDRRFSRRRPRRCPRRWCQLWTAAAKEEMLADSG